MVHTRSYLFPRRILPALIVGLLLLVGCTGGRFVAQGGWSAPAIADSLLFIGTQQPQILALAAENGRRQWSFPPDGEESLGPVYGAPASDGTHVYVGTYSGTIYSLDAETGRMAGPGTWEFTAGDSIVSGPVLANGLVIFGSSDYKVYALDAETGERRWTFTAGDMVWSTPTVAGDLVYIGSLDHNVYALDWETGKVAWEFQAPGAFTSSPTIANGKAYVGSLGKRLYALDAETGELAWTYEGAQNWFWAEPVVKGERVYASNMDGYLYALDAGDGTLQWRHNAGSALLAPPVAGEEGIYVASDEGRVWFLDYEGALRFAPGFVDVKESVRAAMSLDERALYVHPMNDAIVALDPSRGNRMWSFTPE